MMVNVIKILTLVGALSSFAAPRLTQAFATGAALAAKARTQAVYEAARHSGSSLLLFQSGSAAHGDADGTVASAQADALNNIHNITALAATGSHESGATTTKTELSWRMWLYLTFTFTFVLKCLCMFSNVLAQISPIPQVLKFAKRGSTGDVDGAPFVSMLYGGCQWIFYGVFAYTVTGKSGFLVLVYANILGCILGAYYVYGFHSHCRSNQTFQKLLMYYKLASVLVLLQVIALLILERPNALFFVGFVSSFCSMMGACSLLTTLPLVIKTRCSTSINLPLLVTAFFSGCLWLVCGLVLHDAWIVVPQVVGLLLQSFAVAAVLYFPRNGSMKEEPPAAQGLLGWHGQLSAQKKLAHLSNEEASLLPALWKLPQDVTGSKNNGHGMPSNYGTMEDSEDVQQQEQLCGETGGT